MKRVGRSALVLAAVLAAGFGTHPAAIATTASTSTTLPDAVVTIGRTPEGNPIPRGFVGVSLEYRTVADVERSGPGGVDPVLGQLIRNLAPGQTPVVRVGGDSTDWTWWPVPGCGAYWSHLRADASLQIARARDLAVSAGARLILGVNLEADNPVIAAAEAGHLLDGIGRRRIAALEVGNEPELYDIALEVFAESD